MVRNSEARQRERRVRELGVPATIPHVRGRKSSAGAHGSSGGAHSRAWRMRGHFIEHMAGDGVGAVGDDFGPATCRFGEWGLNEVC
jgi:hypothetical protein